MSFPLDILKKTNAIAVEIIIFSIRRGTITAGTDLASQISQQKKKRGEEGDKLMERANELIADLQKEEGEDKK